MDPKDQYCMTIGGLRRTRVRVREMDTDNQDKGAEKVTLLYRYIMRLFFFSALAFVFFLSRSSLFFCSRFLALSFYCIDRDLWFGFD